MNKFFIISVLVTLSSCSSLEEKDESSTLYAIAEGSSLTLNQPLVISSNRSTVILQNGKVVTNEALKIYYPNCAFEIKTLSKTSTTIRPDTFLIYKVIDETMSVSLGQKMFASLGMLADGGGSDLNYTTTMYLQSKQQPDVLRIACMHWESAEDNNYLTIGQMRQAMGKIFTLKLIE